MNDQSHTIHNPILPGFYPDPSICRVGEDFYLVNSTFAFFPGIPVMHSRDLVNWTQIGSVCDRPGQLPLAGAGHSRGLFAPTIRHRDGTFYVLCTNVDHGGNFIVTAKDPAGPWSDPAWLPEAPGIDPSIFFDDDGRAWYHGTRPVPEGPAYNGNWEVWIQEIDLATLKLKGESRGLWRGALREAIWPEGPHIYKINGWYYIMNAEGGTGMDHAISIARSRDLLGPYVGKPANPILTHRDLGSRAAVINVGHGDLFDDGHGGWWMILLASRPYGGMHSNLGRETFIVPVEWEGDWPLPSPGSGRVEDTYPAPNLGAPAPSRNSFARHALTEPEAVACENFDGDALPPGWLRLRGPNDAAISLTERPGFLRLRCGPKTMRESAEVSFAGVRQRHMSWQIRALVDFTPALENDVAGLVLIQNEDYQYRLELRARGGEKGARSVALIKAAGGPDEVLAKAKLDGLCAQGPVELRVRAELQSLSFSFGAPGKPQTPLAADIDGRILSTEVAGGFVGTVLGMFASSNGQGDGPGKGVADFDWFEYRGL